MQSVYYVGPDVHKKSIRCCAKNVRGRIHAEGSIHAKHSDPDRWMKTILQPWTGD
jgi:hypothetical protein